MMRQRTPICSTVGWSNADTIKVHGLDLAQDIMGKLNLGDMAFLQITGRLPRASESVLFNAIAVTLVEHGLTPMALVTRLTYLGAPESVQSAVAAGLCGMGNTFAGTAEGAARMLFEALDGQADDADINLIAKQVVDSHSQQRQPIPGIGHHLHKPVDPRATRLFELAEEHHRAGRYVALMNAIAQQASQQTGLDLPVNATGAIGALCCELGISWQVARGIAVMSRAIGLVGHLVEEQETPIAKEIWLRSDEEAHENYPQDKRYK